MTGQARESHNESWTADGTIREYIYINIIYIYTQLYTYVLSASSDNVGVATSSANILVGQSHFDVALSLKFVPECPCRK